LIPFEHTIKLKEACRCPYEVILPEEMNHNQFDYELDLIFPLKDFLRRHTCYKTGEASEIILPSDIFEIPLAIKEIINTLKINNKKNAHSCFESNDHDNSINVTKADI